MVRKRGDCVVVTEYPHSLNIWQVGLIIGYLTGLVRCVASVYACRRLFWKATRLMFAVNAANIGMQNVFMWAYGAPMRMPPIWETRGSCASCSSPSFYDRRCATLCTGVSSHAPRKPRPPSHAPTRHTLRSPLPKRMRPAVG